jgi:hypothetical protein
VVELLTLRRLSFVAGPVCIGAAAGWLARVDGGVWLAAAVLLSAVLVALAQQTLP